VFGRYNKGGQADVSLSALKTTGEQLYETSVAFPEQSTEYPELARLWAMSRIEQIELQRDIGKLSCNESKESVRDLGVAYQLVTDETSMIVLSTEGFKRHGIDRKNKERSSTERAAQAQRQVNQTSNPTPVSTRVDQSKPMFKHKAPRIGGGGGGAFGIESIALIGLAGLGVYLRRRKHNS
jgi:Ca-activated chloride channel family protein